MIKSKSKQKITIEAIITRADGTIEKRILTPKKENIFKRFMNSFKRR